MGGFVTHDDPGAVGPIGVPPRAGLALCALASSRIALRWLPISLSRSRSRSLGNGWNG